MAELCGVLELVDEGAVLLDAPRLLIVGGGADVVTGPVVVNGDAVVLEDSITVVGKTLEKVAVDGLNVEGTGLVVDDNVNVVVLRRGW